MKHHQSKCPIASAYTEETHWCTICDLGIMPPRSNCKKLVVWKTTQVPHWYDNRTYTRTDHKVYRFHHRRHLCSICNTPRECCDFNGSQLQKPSTSRKCLDCQQTCPDKLLALEILEKMKNARIVAMQKRLTVAEKMNRPKIYFLQLPIDKLVTCLWHILSSPPPDEGPHLLVLDDHPIWVPMSGRYVDHQKTILDATVLVLVPADMCPTQIRLKKYIKRVDMSLMFLLLIVGSIAKLPLKLFTRRYFGAGQDNSVDVHKEQCGGDCGFNYILSNKALPYCPDCICKIIRDVTHASVPPTYDVMTNGVVDWARNALLARFSVHQITTAIKEIVLSFFWKDVVEFAMLYEMETQLMLQEKLKTMCSICGGPCGIFSYLEATADTVMSMNRPVLPWKPETTYLNIIRRESNNTLFDRTGAASFLLQPSFFDLQDAATKQIVKSQKRVDQIEQNLRNN